MAELQPLRNILAHEREELLDVVLGVRLGERALVEKPDTHARVLRVHLGALTKPVVHGEHAAGSPARHGLGTQLVIAARLELPESRGCRFEAAAEALCLRSWSF